MGLETEVANNPSAADSWWGFWNWMAWGYLLVTGGQRVQMTEWNANSVQEKIVSSIKLNEKRQGKKQGKRPSTELQLERSPLPPFSLPSPSPNS